MRFAFGKKPPPPATKKPAERVVMTGIGTVAPQGCSVWRTALGLRFRKTTWCEHETVLLPADRHGVVVRGATVSRLPEDFIPPILDGAERAVALLSPALRSCLAPFAPREIRCLKCSVDNFVLAGGESFLPLLSNQFPLLNVQTSAQSAQLGRCAFFESISDAAEELQSGHQQRIVVGCVDSLCATSWLQAVQDDGIVKDAVTPDGIIPGEAAGVVLLERESAARTRGAPILAVLSSWGRGMERNSWQGPTAATGGGLTEAFADAVSRLADGHTAITSVIADLNGQPERSIDWSYAEGRVFSDGGSGRELRHPAFISGDCGAATGAVMLSDALGKFAFHPSYAGRIALTTSDDSGARRVLVLERGETLDRLQLISQLREGMPRRH